MLMSMIWAPWSALRRAACAICSGSAPAIWTEIGPGSPLWSVRRRVFAVAYSNAFEVTISGDREPCPMRLASWRNGRSVTPAMGATNRLFRKCESRLVALEMGKGDARQTRILTDGAAVDKSENHRLRIPGSPSSTNGSWPRSDCGPRRTCLKAGGRAPAPLTFPPQGQARAPTSCVWRRNGAAAAACPAPSALRRERV